MRFGYRLEADDGATIQFVERLRFKTDLTLLGDRALRGALASLPLLHALIGVSYFKTQVPPIIDLTRCRLTADETHLVRAAYTEGLAEFAYHNRLPDLFDVDFYFSDPHPVAIDALPPASGVLVPFGGGKDSIVSLEAIGRSGRPVSAFVVNPTDAIERALEPSNASVVRVQRLLDPLLLVPAVARYQGHIPITLIHATIAIVAAHIGGFGHVALSNESSASSPNLEWSGVKVNHQWSKGQDAERLLRAAVRSRCGGSLEVFSLLRGLTETAIASRFAALPQYLGAFMSCNRSLRLPRGELSWCSDCDKCRFVYLALAPFIDRAALAAVFGTDLLAEEQQLSGYWALLGRDGHKPFECVADPDECAALIRHLSMSAAWKSAFVVRTLCAEIGDEALSLANILPLQVQPTIPADLEGSLLRADRVRAGTVDGMG